MSLGGQGTKKETPPMGVEPMTIGLKARCSAKLSYSGFHTIPNLGSGVFNFFHRVFECGTATGTKKNGPARI